LFGAIKAGGTKFICAVGTELSNLKNHASADGIPELTIAKALAFLQEESGGNLRALGIASFGPIDFCPLSPTFGHITSTPKLNWQNFNFIGALRAALGVPVRFDSGVDAATLGESRWGAAQSISEFIYRQ
jgi:fructokinase